MVFSVTEERLDGAAKAVAYDMRYRFERPNVDGVDGQLEQPACPNPTVDVMEGQSLRCGRDVDSGYAAIFPWYAHAPGVRWRARVRRALIRAPSSFKIAEFRP